MKVTIYMGFAGLLLASVAPANAAGSLYPTNVVCETLISGVQFLPPAKKVSAFQKMLKKFDSDRFSGALCQSTLRWRMSLAFSALSNDKAALDELQNAVVVLEPFIEVEQPSAVARLALARAFGHLAALHLHRRQHTSHAVYEDISIGLWEDVYADEPDAEKAYRMAQKYVQLGGIKSIEVRSRRAYMSKAVALWKNLHRQMPQDVEVLRELAQTYDQIAGSWSLNNSIPGGGTEAMRQARAARVKIKALQSPPQ